jgi:hypothetical protein
VEVLDMDAGTVQCAANYAPLTPISFIERAAAVYGDRPAILHGEARPITWREARERCVSVAAALAARFGVAPGDVVSACLFCPSLKKSRYRVDLHRSYCENILS